MAERIPYKIGQIMLEMRGAILASVDHNGGRIISVEVVRHWFDQITEMLREYEIDKPDEKHDR